MNKFNFPEKDQFKFLAFEVEGTPMHIYEQAFMRLGITTISGIPELTRKLTRKEVVEANAKIIEIRGENVKNTPGYVDPTSQLSRMDKLDLKRSLGRNQFTKKKYRVNKPGKQFQTLTHTVDSLLKQSKKLLNKSNG